MKSIENKIIEIEKSIGDDSLADGITAVSGALAHILTMAIKQDAFDRTKLNAFFEELEAKIMINTKEASTGVSRPRPSGNKNAGIKRDLS